ncbi:MAG: ion channel [Candidatus Binataceae bacterium]
MANSSNSHDGSEAQRNPRGWDATNVVRTGLRRQGFRNDLYLFLLQSSWPRLVLVFGLGYVVANFFFALAYMLGGDSIENARPGSLVDAFFFSVQTMATIGFGQMVPRTELANVLVTIESLTGLLGLAIATGLVFAKFSRPTARVIFSRVAVISPWEGIPSLMVRMANERDNRIIEAQVRFVLLRTKVTAENVIVRKVIDLPLLRDRNPSFGLSWTAIHPIDERSPLWGATQDSLAANEDEIIVSLTGLDETYAQTIHARRAYRAAEIICNARFADILTRLPDGRMQIDYGHFHDIVPTQPKAHRNDRERPTETR